MADPFVEIAFALTSRSLTILAGTGFSKHVTDGKAPSWLQLIRDLVDHIDDKSGTLSEKLFKTGDSGRRSPKFELYICAQILELEYRKRNFDIRATVASMLAKSVSEKTINEKKLLKLKRFFSEHPDVAVVTTNYDTLFSDFIFDNIPRVCIEGSPIPRVNTGTNIFHIHGCVNRPESLVLTINDYFSFTHKGSYVARKFFTLLHESTVIIMGYSLNDFNLNSILNEARGFRSNCLQKCSIYLVSRESVDRVIKDYYAFTFGVHVIDEYEIDEVFSELTSAVTAAKKTLAQLPSFLDVLKGKRVWKDEFLMTNAALQEILLRASAVGVTADDSRLKAMLIETLSRKRQFTREDNAWTQYEGLADWLIDVGATVQMAGDKHEAEYVDLVKYSFSYMSKEPYKGYSWAAFSVWRSRFAELLLENQKLLRDKIDIDSFSSIHCAGEVFVNFDPV